MSEMRLNIIGGNAYSSTGGIQAVNRMLVRELSAVGLLRRAYFLWDRAENDGAEGRGHSGNELVRFYDLNRGRYLKDICFGALRWPNDLWLCTHVNYTSIGLCANIGRLSRVAVLLHAAELDEMFTNLKRLALCRAGRVFTVSEFTKRKALGLGVLAHRLHVIHNGVDDPCPNWQPSHYCSTGQTILFVGRMDERYKGQMELLDAMTLLRGRFPQLKLVFVGGGQSLSDWRSEAIRRSLESCVEFTGRVSDEDLNRLYSEATIFAMPSENEGFGLVYAEAMAHGVPCIGSDRDAAREVIVHGETGLCVPPGNSTALADAIVTLLRSPNLRMRMSRSARERFLAQFTAGRYAARVLHAVEDWRNANR